MLFNKIKSLILALEILIQMYKNLFNEDSLLYTRLWIIQLRSGIFLIVYITLLYIKLITCIEL